MTDDNLKKLVYVFNAIAKISPKVQIEETHHHYDLSDGEIKQQFLRFNSMVDALRRKQGAQSDEDAQRK